MKIYIEDLTFQCIIGILDFERTSPQDVIINLNLEYDYVDEFINYADVADLVRLSMKSEKYFLIEDALSDLSKKIQEKFAKINTLSLKITKPSILPDCRVSVENVYNLNS